MADKVIVTNLSALRTKYGSGLTRIRAAIRRLVAADRKRGLRTRLVALDSKTAMKKLGAPAVSDAADFEQNKRAIDAIYRKLLPDYIMILGAIDIVPHQNLKNPVFDGDDDPDVYAYSDLPYACEAPYSQKPEDFVAGTWRARDDRAYLPYLGFSAQIWEGSTRRSLRKAFGSADDLRLSPPKGPRWPAAQLQRRAQFINCQGAQADFHFYGEQKRTGAQPVSHTTPWIDGKIAEGTVVAAECCYGSELYDPSLAGQQAGICSTYLAGGAYAVVGATTIAYGEANRDTDADLMCQYFFRHVLSGSSLGRAFLEARQDFAQSAPELDPTSVKTLAQFTLLGDPSIHPVNIPAVPTPQGMRRRKGARAADAARVERHARRQQLMIKGLTIGRTQPTAVRTRPLPGLQEAGRGVWTQRLRQRHGGREHDENTEQARPGQAL